MLGYYFTLGVRSLLRAPWMTLLTVLTLACGIAASVSTLTVLHQMSSDPIPQKSDRLFTLTIDNVPADESDPEVPTLLSWQDVRQLRAAHLGERSSGVYPFNPTIYPERDGVGNFSADGDAVDADFLPMMDAPFRYGGAWSAGDDDAAARVVVLAAPLADKLFGASVNPVGQMLRIDQDHYRIIGVLAPWKVLPPFFTASANARFRETDLFVPLQTALTAALAPNMTTCYTRRGPGFDGLLKSECLWMHYWVETRSASDQPELTRWLHNYVAGQKQAGRLPRPDQAQWFNVRQWLDRVGVVDDQTRVQTWLAFGFLAVCIVNAIGLLLARYAGSAGEIGVRRALGATRVDIALQYLGEAIVIGLIGAALGLLLARQALHLIGSYRRLELMAHMDPQMLVVSLLLSLSAAVVAAALPIWRACQVAPAIQLKSQ